VLAVLFMDLDGFKPVNDSHGHAAGDLVLAAVAHRLSVAVRDSDLVVRHGGDEFVVVLENAGDPDTIAGVVRRLREAVAVTAAVDAVAAGAVVAVTAAVGVVTAQCHRLAGAPGQPVVDPQVLLDAADQAMYATKHDRTGAGVGYAPILRLRPAGPRAPA